MLVEIAYWQHIGTIIDISSEEEAARACVKEVRRLLLEGPYLQFIESAMGDIYAEAVKKCLFGSKTLRIAKDVDQSDREAGVRMLESFATLVVEELGTVKV